MLRRTVFSRLASRCFPLVHSKPTPAQRIRRAVGEVLEERRMFATVPVFGTGTPYYTGNEPRSVVSVDINNDGNLDFLTADSVGGTVTIRRGRGDGTFRPATSINVGGSAIDVVVADFNKDNKLDFAVALPDTDKVGVYLGDGSGSAFSLAATLDAGDLFIRPNVAYGSGAKLAVGDFDGDTNLDLAVTNPEAETISVLLGQGNGQFNSRVVTALSNTTSPVGFTAADFNNDGKTDLAVGTDESLFILFAGVGGGFTVSQQYGAGIGGGHSLGDVHDIVAADLTGDGILDLAVVNGHLDEVTLYKGAANGVFTFLGGSGVSTGSGGIDRGPVALTAADLDGDGALDLAVANLTSDTYAVLINDGTGVFPSALRREVPVYPFNDEGTQETPPTGFLLPQDIAAGDYNNDGKIDLITAHWGQNVRLLLNRTGDPSVNQPVINSFTITPNPAQQGSGLITYTVNASETNGTISRVEFFRETNGIAGLQRTGANADDSTGFGDYINGEWTTRDNPGSDLGTNTVYALVTDAFGQETVGSATYTVTGAPADTSLTVADTSVTEGNSGTKLMTFTVTRSGDTSGVTTVTYATEDGTIPTPNVDYVPVAATTLTFNAGETTKTFSVTIIGDTAVEANEALQVRLTNAVGATLARDLAFGIIENDDTATTTPAAPSSLTGQAVSGNQVNLAWTDNANNETGIEIQRSTVYNFQNPTNITVNGSNLTSYNYTGLSPNTWYYFRVRTTNAAGVSAWSSSVKIKTTSGGTVTPTVPNIPTGPGATANSTSQITVNWTDASNNETGFRIRRSTSSNFSSFTDFTVGAGVTSYVDTGLLANTTYYYMVQSFNGTGASNFTGSVNATTLANSGGSGPLIAPNGLTGTTGQTTALLNWNDNSNNESKWEIQISTVYNFQPGTIVTVNGADLENYTVQNLNSYTWYYFRVRAVNDTNVSAWSSSVKLKTTR